MMNRTVLIKLRAIAVCVILCSAALFAQAQESSSSNVSPLPAPTGPVSDFAGVIDDSVEAALNKRLIDYQRSTGVELAVATVRTTGDREIFDYSLAVYRGWGIGSKGGDNPGALLLIAVDDRKYFTQVSADLEDELPDAVAGSLQRQYLVPELRNGNYGKGVSDTIEAYIRKIDERSSGTAASPTPVPRRGAPTATEGGFSFCFCAIILFIIILVILANRGGRSGGGRSGWGGGFGGGGSALPWIIGSAISNAASSSSSSSSDWGGSSWGGGGSDWGGGGSDWGGFGGGGDASGGGAGGDW